MRARLARIPAVERASKCLRALLLAKLDRAGRDQPSALHRRLTPGSESGPDFDSLVRSRRAQESASGGAGREAR